MIEFWKLRREYGSLIAVRDLNVTMPPGEVYGLSGPNGAGRRPPSAEYRRNR